MSGRAPNQSRPSRAIPPCTRPGRIPTSARMKQEVVPVQIRGILPANSGVALFIGNDEKVFVIQVEHNMGAVIGMALRGAPKDRPLTHDLIGHVFQGFGIVLERVVITELRGTTYFARLILRQENELGKKLVELDARPSDCLALAAATQRPVYVTQTLFDQVEDMSEVLDRLNEQREKEGDDEESAGDEDVEEDEDDDGEDEGDDEEGREPGAGGGG